MLRRRLGRPMGRRTIGVERIGDVSVSRPAFRGLAGVASFWVVPWDLAEAELGNRGRNHVTMKLGTPFDQLTLLPNLDEVGHEARDVLPQRA